MTTAAVTVMWVAFALWSARVGYQRGHLLAGLILGGTLAYIGLVIIALFPKDEAHARELPAADELAARLCAHKHHPAHARSNAKHGVH